MTTPILDALVEALEASSGLPVPTAREYAARIVEQLDARGFEIIGQRPQPHRVPMIHHAPEGIPDLCYCGGAPRHIWGDNCLPDPDSAPNAAVGATTGGVVHAHAPGQVTCWISGCTGTSDDADPASGSYPSESDHG